MKSLINFYLLLVLSLLPSFVAAQNLSNWVTTPNGGEVIAPGGGITVAVNQSVYNPYSIAIELYNGTTKVYGPYFTNTPGTTIYPGSLIGGNFKIRVYEYGNPSKEDWSNAPFTIGPNLASWIQGPNAGTYSSTSTLSVSLNTTTYNPSSVTLEVYKGSTRVWGPQAGGTTGRTITLPGVALGNDYKVRAYDTNIPSLEDWSNNYLSVIDFSSWLTNPNGGGYYIAPGSLSFSANTSLYTPPSGSPSVELYKGSTKVAGPFTVGSNGSITLSSGLTPGADYTLRVFDPYDLTIQDYSNSTFTIGPNLASWIQTPNGGTYALNSTINVQLNTGTYSPSSVALELYKGTTKVWGPFSGAATGRTVPLTGLTAGTDYKLKAYDSSIPTLVDWSDNNISIVDLSNWLTAPNGGEVGVIGGSMSFSANTSVFTPPQGAPSIEIYKGVVKVSGPTTIGNIGSLLIPSGLTPGNDYKVFIYDPQDIQKQDYSNSTFTLGPNLASWIQIPNGGTYALNSTINVQLNTGTYSPSSVTLELYKGSIKVWGPFSGAATGRTVPLTGLIAGTDYKLKAYDASIPTLVDWSDYNISIVNLSSWLTTPNGGESFIIPGQLNFAANTSIFTPPSGAPAVELYKGAVKVAGPYTVGNIGSIPLGASLTPGIDYKLRIYDPQNTQNEDYSDNTFSIAPNLTSWIQTPNGGAFSLNADISVVLNTTTFNPASVTLELYKGSTKVWGPFSGLATGRVIPTVGLVAGTDYKLKAYDSSIPVFADWSDYTFSILNLSSWLTTPNGGESFVLGGSLNFIANTSVYTPPSGAPAVELYKGTTKVAGPFTVGNFGSITIPKNIVYGSDFYFKIYDPYSPGAFDFSDGPFFIGTDQNYIKVEEILISGVKTETDISSTTSKIVNYEYVDGLGRPVQMITSKGSPGNRDIIQPIVYDAYGRVDRRYLPFTANVGSTFTPSSEFIDSSSENYKGIALPFYSSSNDGLIANTTKPFAKAFLENSPLNRVLAQGSSGSSWQPDAASTYESPVPTDHSARFSYASNSENEVIKWSYSSPTVSYPLGLVNANTGSSSVVYYTVGELYKTQQKDERHNEVIEYKDKSGLVILKKVQKDSEYAQTYYIYDDLDNLVCVIPPEALKAIIKAPTSDYFGKTDAEKDLFLKRWAFRYVYDGRNRASQKQVPGAEPVYMIYDNRDRLILTQDGNQRISNNWSFTKYDGLNRPVMTGVKDTIANLSQGSMQGVINTFFTKASSRWSESRGTAVHGYTNRSYPVLPDTSKYLTVAYYDDYEWQTGLYDVARLQYDPGQLPGELPPVSLQSVNGMKTGSKVKVLDGSKMWLYSVDYFDERARVIQTISDNIKGGTDCVTNVLDFIGKVMKSKTRHRTYDISLKDKVAMYNGGHWIRGIPAGPGWGSSGTASVQTLAAGASGWIEATVPTRSSTFALGLSSSNPNANVNTMNFGIVQASGQYFKCENCTGPGTNLGTAASPGDVIKIERISTTIKYYRNGVLLPQGTSGVTSLSALMADISFYFAGSGLTNIRASFAMKEQVVVRTFEYDHAGRLKKTWHKIDNGPNVLLLSNDYNELGQLIDKRLHSEDNGVTGKQSVDYRYNIRGWLTSINEAELDPSSANVEAPGQVRDFFGVNLMYDEVQPGLNNKEFFNGNISAIRWTNNLGLGVQKQNAYKFDYDNLNRITQADFHKKTNSWNPGTNFEYSEKDYEYDLNGNIKTLKRYGKNGLLMDNLSYDYGTGTVVSNKLLKVTDVPGTSKTAGFKDGLNSGNDFTYDANGNMIADANKSLSIGYNLLNLPSGVSRGTNSSSLSYIYDATGRKHSQIANYWNFQRQTDYIGEFEYEDDVLQAIHHDEGRAVVEARDLIYHHDGSETEGITTANSGLTQSGVDPAQTYVRVDVSATATKPGAFPIGGAFFVQGGERYLIRSKGWRPGGPAYIYVKTGVNADGSGGTDLEFRNAPLPAITADADSWVESIVTIPGSGTTRMSAGLVFESTVSTVQAWFFMNEFEIYKLQHFATPEYQYALKDHLGNVRLTFTTTAESDVAVGTMETQNQVAEQAKFLRYENARRVSSFLFDHTSDAAGAGATTVYSNDFSSSTSPFYGTGTFAVSLSSGRLKGSGASQWDPVLMSFATTAGDNYKITFDIDLAGSTAISFFAADPWTGNRPVSGQIPSNGTYSFTFTAQNVTSQIYFQNGASTPRDIYLDNILIENISPAGVYAQRLNGTANEKYGLARSLSVMPGDLVKMEVYAKYVDTTAVNRTAFLNALISQITAGTLQATRVDGAGYLTSTSSFHYGGILGAEGSTSGPKAYLNWLVFDRDYTYLYGDYRRLSASPKETGQNVAHEKLWGEILIKEAGYVYVYLSNEDTKPIDVYFDDFKVEHVKSPVIQSQDYYPFGLAFNSYGRENSLANQYQYNGKEEQDELSLGWLDYGQRMYQPELGRFFSQDRFASKYFDTSPYSYGANNPALYIDINGDSVWTTHNSATDINGNTTITHTINITGKVLKQSSGTASARGVAAGLNSRLNAQGSTTTKKNADGTTTTEITKMNASYQAASSMDDVSNSDHLVVITDGVLGDSDPKLGGGGAAGLGMLGGQVSIIEDPDAVETAFHEVGHNLGLSHPDSNSDDPMSYTGRGGNFSPAQMDQILNNGIYGVPNRGSNSGTMGTLFPNVKQGTFYGQSDNTRPFRGMAPDTRARVPLPLINGYK